MQIKIAIIGDRGSVHGFKAVGFDVFEADKNDYIGEMVDKLAGMGYGIIFVTEDLVAQEPELMERYKTNILPAVVPIPGRLNSFGVGIERIHRNVEKAVGTDIFDNE